MGQTMAQNLVDAGRFGTTDIAGTARYRSMAGAFGALGGDVTCMTDNPAGIGVFRGTSVLSFSPTLSIGKTNTDGTTKQKAKKSDFCVSNLGYIISIRPEESEHLVNFNIGLGFNHSEGVNRKYKMTHDNPKSSFGEYVQTRANNALRATNHRDDPGYLDTDAAWEDYEMPLIALMGYGSYAINDNEFGNGVISYDKAQGLQSFQRLDVSEKNRLEEYNINLSGNWEDKLYAGITLSVIDYNSIITSNFYEDYSYDYDGDYTEYYNDLETQGSGCNIKLGILYKPLPEWRVGLAFHTPTWYQMKDYYNGAMITNDTRCTDYVYANMNGSYEYRYRYTSPWQVQLSTAYVFGTKAIASIEYDLKDFSSCSYKDSEGGGKEAYSGTNGLISSYMQKQHTIKAGLEYRLTDELSLRLGYAHQTSPYSKELLEDNLGNTGWSYQDGGNSYWGDDRTTMLDASTKPNYSLLDGTNYFCGGIGWAKNSWTFDLAIMDRYQSEKIAAFPTTQSVDFDTNWNASFKSGATANHVDMKCNSLKIDFTIGYKF